MGDLMLGADYNRTYLIVVSEVQLCIPTATNADEYFLLLNILVRRNQGNILVKYSLVFVINAGDFSDVGLERGLACL
jgi:hypothetical protein